MTNKTKVIFRKWKSDNDIIALFPEDPWDVNGFFCSSYMHMGQHGSADPDGVITATTLATPEEYASLKFELESIGYELDIRKKYTRHMYETRKQTLKQTLGEHYDDN